MARARKNTPSGYYRMVFSLYIVAVAVLSVLLLGIGNSQRICLAGLIIQLQFIVMTLEEMNRYRIASRLVLLILFVVPTFILNNALAIPAKNVKVVPMQVVRHFWASR